MSWTADAGSGKRVRFAQVSRPRARPLRAFGEERQEPDAALGRPAQERRHRGTMVLCRHGREKIGAGSSYPSPRERGYRIRCRRGSLPLKGGGLGWGSIQRCGAQRYVLASETPSRLAALADLPLSGGGEVALRLYAPHRSGARWIVAIKVVAPFLTGSS